MGPVAGSHCRITKNGPPLLLVGGQAINLWALHYYERTMDLAPFVSHDVDLLGDRETLAEVAKIGKFLRFSANSAALDFLPQKTQNFAEL